MRNLGMDFEWDPTKNQENRRKHGITFEQASVIWDGPLLKELDERDEYGEDRFIATGQLPNLTVLVVV
jgi:uncharacterized DUF497 family protein